MSKPLITVGLAFRNVSPYLGLALRSLLCQSFPDWEAILIDDASTDDSLDVVRSLPDRRFKLICGKQQLGVHIRRNQAVAMASGRYFAIMDGDDVMHPDRLRIQQEALTAADDRTVVGSRAYSIDAESNVVGLHRVKKSSSSGFGVRHALINPTVMGYTTWFRRNPWSERAIFQRAQDAELWCRTAAESRFHVIPQPLLYYREAGTFKLYNQVATSVALVAILNQHFGKRRGFVLWQTGIELLKLSLAMGCDSVGCREVLVRRRYVALPSSQREQATATLRTILTSGGPAVHPPQEWAHQSGGKGVDDAKDNGRYLF